MIINDAIKAARDSEGLTNAELARRAGKSPQFANDMYKRRDLAMSTSCRFAEALGYELVLRKAGERDGIIITAED